VTAIETGALDDETVRRVDELLRQHGKAIHRIERPRQRLESLFLDIVEQAQKEGVATSGARAGGRIAQFLVDGDEALETGQAQAEAVIQSLVTKPAAEPIKPAQAEPAEASPSKRQVQEVLSHLTAPKAAPKPAPAVVPSPPAKGAADLDVIQGLVQPASKPKPSAPVAQSSGPAPAKAPAAAGPKSAPTPELAKADKPRGEAPDEQFIAALQDVPEFDEQEDGNKAAGGKSGSK
jgi:hypothetical protein